MTAVIYSGVALFFAGVFGQLLGQLTVVIAIIGLFGFAVTFLAMLVAQFYFRCPRCGGNLGVLMLNRPNFSMNRRVHFCPFCGGDLDEELVEEEAASANDRV